MTPGEELLAMAEALGWPADVPADDFEVEGKVFFVSGGSEAAWRAWLERLQLKR